ncbi:MAG TPA: NEW3 domain-containing protein, partial [Planctomycetota bacterium]|nr:NEW3 domain-containing protein [Planctomycetota bacterium]
MRTTCRVIGMLVVACVAAAPLSALGDEPAPAEPAAEAPGITVAWPAAVLVHGTNAVKLQFQNASAAAAAGTVELKLPAGWTAEPPAAPFSLQAGQPNAPAKAEIAFTVKTPLTSPPGRYELNALLDDKTAQKTFGPFPVKLTTPLGDLAGIELAEIYGPAPSMAVPVQNVLPAKLTARVGISAADWTTTPGCIPIELQPGESRLLRFVIDGRLPVVGSLPVIVRIALPDRTISVRRTVDISRYRTYGWAIGKPTVQALRFDGRVISYNLPNMTTVSARIYDSKGSIVRVLDSGWQAAGPHSYEWMPDRDAAYFDEWAAHTIEVRAGLGLVFERQIAPPDGAIFFPRSIAVDGSGIINVFEGVRAMR